MAPGIDSRELTDASDIRIKQLVEGNIGLIYAIARRYGLDLPYDDRLQAGRIGLMRAAMTWDPSRSEFSTYAYLRIRAEINYTCAFEVDTVRLKSRDPMRRRMMWAERALHPRLAHGASSDDLAEAVGGTREEVENILLLLDPIYIDSLDADALEDALGDNGVDAPSFADSIGWYKYEQFKKRLGESARADQECFEAMHFSEDPRSAEMIAERLSINAGTVRWRAHRAFIRMCKAFDLDELIDSPSITPSARTTLLNLVQNAALRAQISSEVHPVLHALLEAYDEGANMDTLDAYLERQRISIRMLLRELKGFC